MAKLPIMKLFVPDVVSDTITLSDAEFGAYFRICMALWRHKGVLPLDDDLRKIAGTSPKNWPKRWPRIVRYFVVDGVWITHSRITEDLAALGVLAPPVDSRRSPKVAPGTGTFGIPGESNRSDKPLESLDPVSPLARARQPQLQPELEPVSGLPSEAQPPRAPDDWPDGGIDAWSKHLCALSSGKLDTSKSLSLITGGRVVAEWKLAGASFSLDVVPVVVGLCQRQKRNIASWTYFDGAVRDALDNRRESGALTPRRHGRDDKFARKHDNLARALVGARGAVARERDDMGGGPSGD